MVSFAPQVYDAVRSEMPLGDLVLFDELDPQLGQKPRTIIRWSYHSKRFKGPTAQGTIAYAEMLDQQQFELRQALVEQEESAAERWGWEIGRKCKTYVEKAMNGTLTETYQGPPPGSTRTAPH